VFAKVLVANRGEVAVRVIRALHELGIASVAVYSEADRDALHVRLADEAVAIGPAPAAESYLHPPAVLRAARTSGCEALHPGYGFLSENAAFARACAEAGIVFVGPSPEAIEAMGEKTRARDVARRLGIPVVPGSDRAVETLHDALAVAERIGYPVAVKASGGGGGIGFRTASGRGELEATLDAVRADGQRFFGNAEVYLERYFEDPRHVEIQVLGDARGTIVQLGERDCSVQRRHQKLIEESPAPTVDDALRERLGSYALELARAIGYASAGTIEGLLVGKEFYFLEMNTRLQVEHPVTELVTGVDLVHEQLRIAAGHALGIRQEDVVARGVALECRINAESAHRQFLPSPGTIDRYREPAGPGIRVDSGVEEGSLVTPFYDSLLAKVVTWGETREAATALMEEALAGFELEGVNTLIPFHRQLLATQQWRAAETCRDLLGDRGWLRGTAPVPPPG
jgi:acetyl-CoA/propionyl-CoA/long-chain acyl-CoA carboxylase, biotin carboxylase, biotin carboxyl carrier protein